MKIIKSFEDKDFFECYYNNTINDYKYKIRGQWFWGLNDDGELCFYNTVICNKDQWIILNEYVGPMNKLSIHTMSKIVKEFEHLLAFI